VALPRFRKTRMQLHHIHGSIILCSLYIGGAAKGKVGGEDQAAYAGQEK
jgi:hypothetical protein